MGICWFRAHLALFFCLLWRSIAFKSYLYLRLFWFLFFFSVVFRVLLILIIPDQSRNAGHGTAYSVVHLRYICPLEHAFILIIFILLALTRLNRLPANRILYNLSRRCSPRRWSLKLRFFDFKLKLVCILSLNYCFFPILQHQVLLHYLIFCGFEFPYDPHKVFSYS